MMAVKQGEAYSAFLEQIGELIQRRLDEGETFKSIAQGTGINDATTISNFRYGFIKSIKPNHFNALCEYFNIDVVIQFRDGARERAV